MIQLITKRLTFVLTVMLLLATATASSAEVGPNDLVGQDKASFDKFRDLFQNGAPDEFYSYTKEYGEELKSKGYMMLYYKLKNNEGFYALRHNMIFRAVQAAEELDAEMRKDGANNYFYLATGLMGDVYYVCHDRTKAEQYFTQAIDEAGDRDPKFTMRCYQSLAELLCVKDSKKALDWMEKSLALARKTNNVEYEALTLAMTGYTYFLAGNGEAFSRVYNEYIDLRSMDLPGFNHRYDNMMEIARMAFNGDYQGASKKLGSGGIYVDSSLVAIRIFAMERDVDKGFGAITRRLLEMDSIHSLMQSANFDQLASERTLLRSREEALSNKRLAKRLTNWLIGLSVAFLIIYVMGRRRLMLKIWDKNKELKDALMKAEESERMKSDFIRNMSHQIRTPLNAINGFSQLLCMDGYVVSAKEKREMMGRITENVGTITTIVAELLDMSRDDSVRVKTCLNVNSLCREVLEGFEVRNPKGLELTFDTALDDEFVIKSDETDVKRILSQLLDNALKFTEKGSVCLRCEQKNGQLQLTVTDTGIGIQAEHRKDVFDSFVKLDEYAGGVGLGLPISRRLARALGGDVTIDDTYTSGSRFIVTLPIN